MTRERGSSGVRIWVGMGRFEGGERGMEASAFCVDILRSVSSCIRVLLYSIENIIGLWGIGRHDR